MSYDLAVVIGRFQPCHYGHLYMIEQALKQANKVLILVGSSHRARTVKNPFSFRERQELLIACIAEQHPEFVSRVVVEPLEDQMYWEQRWIDQVRALARQHCPLGSVALVGHDKDDSTYYLAHFQDWPFVSLDNYQAISATPVRQAYLLDGAIETEALPKATQQFLADFKRTEHYVRLSEEAHFLQRYKSEWSQTPYPVLFVTTDAVVTCNGCVLLVKRKYNPGKGLWALPGGFLEVGEWVREGLLRELKEETSIAVDDGILLQHLHPMRVFDHPGRSQVGRVITHAGWIELPDQALPVIQADDDAEAVEWFPLSELSALNTHMHDDHYYIVKAFLEGDHGHYFGH